MNAHPRNQGGLAPSTFERYTSVANRHLLGKPRRGRRGEALPPARYALAVASVPAVRFNEPQAPRAWREEMMGDGTPKPTREHAWRVLSAALSWAAGSQMVPEIQTNGCILANEGVLNRRSPSRTCADTGHGQPTSSGATHAQPSASGIRTGKHRPPRQTKRVNIADGCSLPGLRRAGDALARDRRRSQCRCPRAGWLGCGCGLIAGRVTTCARSA